jgi:hypothetical protein
LLPVDWADGAVEFASDADQITRLDRVWELCDEHGVDEMLLEREYIDADYRDEYSHFYASTFRRLPDRCERLHFYASGRYVGFAVMRPILGRPVCRTMIAPPPALVDSVSCVASVLASPYG